MLSAIGTSNSAHDQSVAAAQGLTQVTVPGTIPSDDLSAGAQQDQQQDTRRDSAALSPEALVQLAGGSTVAAPATVAANWTGEGAEGSARVSVTAADNLVSEPSVSDVTPGQVLSQLQSDQDAIGALPATGVAAATVAAARAARDGLAVDTRA